MTPTRRAACFPAALLVVAAVGAAAWAAPPRDKAAALAQLKHARFAERAAALEFLGATADVTVVDAVVDMLEDKDATVRWAAVDALEKLGDARAIPALKAAQRDPAPLVANRATAAVAALARTGVKAGAVRVLVTTSGNDVPAIREALKANAYRAFGARARGDVAVTEKEDDATHVMTVSVRSTRVVRQGTQTILEVTCSGVLTQQPGNALRFATRVGAGVGVEGEMGEKDRAEAMPEAVQAAASAIGEEVADHLAQQGG